MSADLDHVKFLRIKTLGLGVTVASALLFAASLAPVARGYGQLLFGLAVAAQILVALSLLPALSSDSAQATDAGGAGAESEGQDQTALAELESKLVQAREEAAAARATVAAKDSEIDRFTYIVSHDLRSPLLTIQGFADILLMDVEEGKKETIAEDIDHILKATQRMRLLLDDLLELSRIGRFNEPASEVSLTAVAGDAAKELESRIDAAQAEVIVADNLPTASVDRSRIQQLFRILIDNSLRYHGEEPPRVEITGRQNGDGVEIIVRDHGVGMEADQLEKAFGPFERFSAESEGSGMGLAHAQRIVGYHRGTIRAESAGSAQGTSIIFSLREPRVDEPTADDTTPA